MVGYIMACQNYEDVMFCSDLLFFSYFGFSLFLIYCDTIHSRLSGLLDLILILTQKNMLVTSLTNQFCFPKC